jgi:hypothetical protein
MSMRSIAIGRTRRFGRVAIEKVLIEQGANVKKGAAMEAFAAKMP